MTVGPVVINLLPTVIYFPTPESQSEKMARGALYAAIQRLLSLDTIVIVDALNYIKGFRYQMYCAAREMKLRFCTVQYMFFFTVAFCLKTCNKLYVVATYELCRERNNLRLDGHRYTPETYVCLWR